MNYKQDYEAKYKEDASTFGGHAYDAFLIVAEAVKKAGTTDKERSATPSRASRASRAPAGVFNFSPTDHNGLTLDAFEMLTVKNGQFVLYQPGR